MKYLYHDTRDFTDSENQYAALPVGNYKAMITRVEEKISNSTGNPYINLTLEIMEGTYAKRKVWDILSVKSDNPVAVSMAKRKLDNIAKALGLLVIQDADDFKFKEIGIELVLDKKDAGKNQIKRYIPAREVVSFVPVSKVAKDNVADINDAPF